MNLAIWKLSLILGATLFAVSCGTKRYAESERCEDLSTIFFTEQDVNSWSVAQRNAVTRFESLGGNWRVTLDCQGEPDDEARLEITQTLRSNVEMYDDVQDIACDSFGKAVFEAKISQSGDIDLDDTTFVLTADLKKPDGAPLLEARSAEKLSQYKDTAAFSLHIIIDDNGQMKATKQVTMTPEISNANGTISVTQRNVCTFTDWIAQ